MLTLFVWLPDVNAEVTNNYHLLTVLKIIICIKATLEEIILRRVRPGTHIITDCWAAYNTIEDHGYTHLTVNHSLNFVDPDTYAHTQNVENFWMRAKFRSKKERGTSKNLLPSYLQEF